MTKCLMHAGFGLALILGFACPAIRAAEAASAPSEARMTPMVRAIQRAVQSTVNIHSEKRSRAGDPLSPAGKKVNGMGTGVVVDERGYIVTNYHVVQDVDSLQVTLWDNTTYSARVVSFDSREDLAMIKISASQPLEVMPMGTSSDLLLGEDVLAIGNAFGYPHTVTRGIISALGRDVEVNDEQAYRNLVQIDAAINPGNSGGPLINRDGDMIAINVAIRAGAQKIGFAIPVDDARRTIARLLNVERLNNNYHGLTGRDEKQGTERKLVVEAVDVNSPAAAAGLQPGDVVLKAANVSVVDAADFERALLGRSVGERVDVTVSRSGEEQTLQLELARLSGARSVAGRQSVPSTTVSVSKPIIASSASVETGDGAWDILGMKLVKADSSSAAFEGQSYRGGMEVSEVRPGSPAAQNGIRSGDVLVGLHVWETVTPENVDYVLKHPQFSSFTSLKFYILREKETLYGHFQLAAR